MKIGREIDRQRDKHNCRISVIVKIDKRFLPWTYSLSSHPNKKYYFFELRRVTTDYPGPAPLRSDSLSKIYVEDYAIENSSILRSGKAHHKTIFYTIKRGTKFEKVTRESLEFFKKILGNNALEYSSKFFEPKNRHLRI